LACKHEKKKQLRTYQKAEIHDGRKPGKLRKKEVSTFKIGTQKNGKKIERGNTTLSRKKGAV